jgi:SAM-dependent methyltransferase
MNRKMRRAAATDRNRRLASRPAAAEPDFLSDLLTHGRQMRADGHDEQAMEIAAQALRLRETDDSKAFFVQCLKHWSYFPGAEEMRDVFVRALREPWTNSNELIGTIKGVLDHDPVIGPAMRRVDAHWPVREELAELLGALGLAKISKDPLLLALLESSKYFGLELERFLTTLRTGLLNMTMRADSYNDEDVVRLSCALARQCFITEYVFDLTGDEHRRVTILCDRISHAIASGDEISPFELAVLAAYQNLENVAGHETLLKRTWPDCVESLLNQQVCEPAAERRQRSSIPKITPIIDTMSVSVREQYEDNPYPRWINIPAATAAISIDEFIGSAFPFCKYRNTGKTDGCDLLVAGCGTGQHPILVSRNLRGARTLAVDLSLASLCYAKQRTRALGLTNIDYAQADITELGNLTRSFDLISCVGVLHHLANPEQGWATLLSLLRPGGCMHIGLYSEIAHRHLIAAQTWLRTRGYTSSAQDIRRARQDLAAAAAHEPTLKDVLTYVDFYSMSECRDLLFHRRDDRFTIPRLHTFLGKNKLRFLGFEVNGAVRDRFAQRFARESEADLLLWHEFEVDNPDTFKGMYQFYVQTA